MMTAQRVDQVATLVPTTKWSLVPEGYDPVQIVQESHATGQYVSVSLWASLGAVTRDKRDARL